MVEEYPGGIDWSTIDVDALDPEEIEALLAASSPTQAAEPFDLSEIDALLEETQPAGGQVGYPPEQLLEPATQDSGAEQAFDALTEQATKLPPALGRRLAAVLSAYTHIYSSDSAQEKAVQIVNFEHRLSDVFLDIPDAQEDLSILDTQIRAMRNELQKEIGEAEKARPKEKPKKVRMPRPPLGASPKVMEEWKRFTREQQQEQQEQEQQRRQQVAREPVPEVPPEAVETRRLTPRENSLLEKLLSRSFEPGEEYKLFESDEEQAQFMEILALLQARGLDDDRDKYLTRLVERQYIGTVAGGPAKQKPRRLRSLIWTQDAIDQRIREEEARQSGLSPEEIAQAETAAEKKAKITVEKLGNNPVYVRMVGRDERTRIEKLEESGDLKELLDPIFQGKIFEQIPGLENEMLFEEPVYKMYKLMLAYFNKVDIADVEGDVGDAQEAYDNAMDIMTGLFDLLGEKYPEEMAGVMPSHKLLVTKATMDMIDLGGNTEATEISQREAAESGIGLMSEYQENPEEKKRRVNEYYEGWSSTWARDPATGRAYRKRIFIPMLGQVRREKKKREAEQVRRQMLTDPEQYKKWIGHRRKSHELTREEYWADEDSPITITRQQPRTILVGGQFWKPPGDRKKRVEEFLGRSETREMLDNMEPAQRDRFLKELQTGQRDVVPVSTRIREGREELLRRLSPEEKLRFQREQRAKKNRQAKFTPQADSFARQFVGKPKGEPLTNEEKLTGTLAHAAMRGVWDKNQKLARIGAPFDLAKGNIAQIRQVLQQRERDTDLWVFNELYELRQAVAQRKISVEAADFIANTMEKQANNWIPGGRGWNSKLALFIEPLVSKGFLDKLVDKRRQLEKQDYEPKEIRDVLFEKLDRELELRQEALPKAASRLQQLLSLAENKTVERHGDALEISEALLDDLLVSLRGTQKSVGSHLDKLEKEQDKIPREDIENIRDFTGNTALLCNMILSGKGYSREDRRQAILDLAG
jgi:hypothetical protein